MATLLLQTAGSIIGGGPANPLGAFLGAQVGRLIGSAVDDAVFGPTRLPTREGPRLAPEDLLVQTSTYGRMVPIVYGSARIAGNVIWSRPIQETVVTTTHSAGGKGGGGKVEQTTRTYAYSVSLAIALCEGEIDAIQRVWADARQLNLGQGTYRLYLGSETQLPDPFIESFEGVGRTPAYRGLAYVVIEDFPLGDYGNRIPNFTFEVKKKVLPVESSGETTEEMVRSVVMIPGSGEFVYDTQLVYKVTGEQAGTEFAQAGDRRRINHHNHTDKANALLSLDQLAETLPNVEWVAVVVNWFGTSLNAGECEFFPGVEYQEGAVTEPETWSVAGYGRNTARQITLEDGTPRYGGTPDDQSLLRYLDELRARGYKIMLYPMPLMDVEDKPWRGRITGAPADVVSIFTKTNGYNAFITHYATLAAGRVDAFVIGSELKGLTGVMDTPSVFPAVDALVNLAAMVKSILGSGVKVTYAADWSEYHHTDGGWYHMDKLWASHNIDFVGIDAYFPLTDSPQSGIDLLEAIDGWTGGEGYDWYYTDGTRTTRAPLSAPYAWKNIAWWWENQHVNPDAHITPWVPRSKKIWFTEYGFPSVDGATNQPNVFYDPASIESFFPHHSRGQVDFRAQRLGITATELMWKDSEFLERRFLWTWDARPFPYFPDRLDAWADGGNWKFGHWVQGKLGLSSLAAIVRDLCLRAGLDASQIDASRLDDVVEGFVLTRRTTPRAAIEALMGGYFFDAVASGSTLTFIPRGQESVAEIEEGELLPMPREGEQSAELLTIVRRQELELPQAVDVTYINRTANYQVGTQHSTRQTVDTEGAVTLALPIVMPDSQAKAVADSVLYSAWLARTSYVFRLPMRYAWLEPADVVRVHVGGAAHTVRIMETRFGKPGVVEIEAVAEDSSLYDFASTPGENAIAPAAAPPVSATALEMLDIPAFPGDPVGFGMLRFAASGKEAQWKGAAIYRSEDGGGEYQLVARCNAAAVQGRALDALPAGVCAVFDDANAVTVLLSGAGELASASELAVLNGANAALLGEEILQFKNAELLAPHKYRLSGLLRGRLGTEYAVGTHAAGEGFLLLDGRIVAAEAPNSLIGLSRLYKAVSIGSTLGAAESQGFTYSGRPMKPYAPVHIAGSRDDAGNLTITWVRRDRLHGEWRDYIDTPLAEAAEAYEVDILNGATVVRTLSGLTAPGASYSAADQSSDFGSPQSSITLRVYQLSANVGRGIAATATV